MGFTILGALKLEGLRARAHESFMSGCFCPYKDSKNKKQL